MNVLQEVYFKLGKLNIQLHQAQRAYFLLPMIVRQGVLSLNCNTRRIEFETLFAPNVAENPNREVLTIVKEIKTINDYISNNNFGIDEIKNIYLSFDKNAKINKLDNISFSYDLDCLKSIYEDLCIYNNELSLLTFSVIANIFFVKGNYIPLPILDVAKAVIKSGSNKDFYKMLLLAIDGTESILNNHKKLVKEHLQIAEKANMKSVVLEYYYLLESPVLQLGQHLEDLNMTFATLSKATSILENSGILKKIAGSQRYRIFKYDSLCKLFSN